MNLRKIAIYALAAFCLCSTSGFAATIHDRTEKLAPVATDKVAVSDSQDGGKTKSVQLGNLPVSAPTQNALDTQGDLDIVSITLTGEGILTLTLKGGGTVTSDISALLDNTDDQIFTDFSIDGTTLSITLENGNTETVNISSIQDGTGTDDQTAAEVAVDASGFNGNLSPTDNTVQKVAQKLDDLTVGVGSGDITGVTAGTGLTGGGESGPVTLSVNPAAIQTRIATACSGTQKMTGVNQDGTPICADDEIGAAGTGDITGVVAGNRMTGGGTAGSVTVGVDAATDAEITANTDKRSYPAADETKLSNIPASPDHTYISDFDIAVTANALFAQKADKSNVLEKDNTTAFTPDADYEPATKKYVDDNVGAGGIADAPSDGNPYGRLDGAWVAILQDYTETDPVFTAWDKDYADLINTPVLGTAAGFDVGTDAGNILQASAACTIGDGTYIDQTTCEAAWACSIPQFLDQSACETNEGTWTAGEWVGVLPFICDPDVDPNGCISEQDPLSAAEIDKRIGTKTISTSQPTGGTNGDVWYVVE